MGKKRKSAKRIIVPILVLAIFAGVWSIFIKSDKAHAPESSSQNLSPTKPKTGKVKTFTTEEFSNLYNSFVYPNTQLINEKSPITSNEAADNRIRELAVAKGYKLRSAPVADTFVEVQKGFSLQQRASQPWLDLKQKAAAEGISLSLSAAYRSAQDQRTIFLDRLKQIPLDSIAAGTADAQVNKVLASTALPGYSRHHTGYTVDIVCDNEPSVEFKKSKCFTWLNNDNYLNAKKSGWIPSYPEGITNQGPDPESWEYVWVGTEALTD